MHRKLIITAALFFFIANAGNALAGEIMCNDPVDTASGKLAGIADGDATSCAWLGVPYAAPPVGELRWKAPAAPAKWDGVKQADRKGPWCLQKKNTPIYDPTTNSDDVRFSEDCLYLNVWKPRKEGKFPVMVWIHGGGYTTGSGNIDMYRGDRLSALGNVVVVTINYRINVFGFLSSTTLAAEDPNNSSGNYGSLDQIAALKWVKENIASFGGDPDNVTIFGESAGGWSVCTMVATPLAKGLFQHAIIESGGCESATTMENGDAWSAKLTEKLGCAPKDFACMRKIPAKKLMEAGWADLLNDPLIYVNHFDKHLIDKTPLAIINAGEHNKVPMLIGSNRDEARPIVMLFPKYWRMNRKKMVRIIKADITPDAEKLIALYPLENYTSPREAYADMTNDRILNCPGYIAANALSKNDKPVWYYRFDWDDTTILQPTLGAFHGLEIPFVFRGFDRKPIKRLFGKKSMKSAVALSEKMMAYWTNFAKTGDPNAAGLPEWPTYKAEGDRKRIRFDNEITVHPEPAGRDAQCDFWKDLPWGVKNN